MDGGRSTNRVKNKAPAPIQITAEQLLREAQERSEAPHNAPRQRVEDLEELSEFRGRKRREFEEVIRRTRSNIAAWIKYAYWEASQGEFARSRSVYERALDVDPTDVKLWLSYTEMELKGRNISHARNLFDRAVTLLPRISQIWYKYVYLEELLGNVAGARQVFERWMAWEPDEKAWSAYIKMESRYHEYQRASNVYERLVACHPEPKIWIRWAKFEEDVRSNVPRAREIFQMSLEYFGAGEGGEEEEEQLEKSQSLYNAFAKLEIRQKEYERARVIYKYALDRLPRSKSQNLYTAYSLFEKQFGDRQGIESTVLGKRRIEYEEELKDAPLNYDIWVDYSRLEEDAFRSEGVDAQSGGADRVRDVYERAIAQRPPSNEKRHWRRYIFLWLNYAMFEELDTKDYDRARQIYEACIKLIPHKSFTFAKLWSLYAQFEVRQLQLEKARKIMGTAIGMCPKEKLFKDYITLEIQLREFDRCRQLYQKYLAYDVANSTAFIKFAELEKELGDFERARGIFELAITQPLDMPEILWKAYIDFEYEEEEWDRTRALYRRLLERTSHVKVWMSWAQFESNAGKTIARAYRDQDKDEDEMQEETAEANGASNGGNGHAVSEEAEAAAQEAQRSGLEQAREVFRQGYKDLKSKQLKQERLILLEAWKALETEDGDSESLAKVEAMMPRVVKKRRTTADGNLEEYHDYLFADDEEQKGPGLSKLLMAAQKWKKQQQEAQAA